MKEDNSITVLKDFNGSMIGDYQIKNNNLFISLKKDKPTFGYRNKKFDYNLHFHIGLFNSSNSEKTMSIFIECKNKKILKYNLPRLWLSDNIDKEYKITKNITGNTNFNGQYYIKINIDKKQKLYIANYPPIRYSKLKNTFQQLANISNAKENKIGKTVEGRDITAYEFGDINHKPTILFVSGFHPPERDTIAIEAIIDKFQDKDWKDNVLSKYSFSFIPILNPDGFANKKQGSNINDINFHWKFFGNSNKECPEAYNIWNYCLKIKPIVFFDFHAFTFQDNTARPYIISEGYYIGKKARSLQKFLNENLKKICGNNYSKNETILAPNLLATKLRNELGTITVPKFHLHMKDGITGTKEMSLKCLDAALIGLNDFKIYSTDEILKIPHGKIKTTIFDKIRIKLLNFWYFYLIYLLKRIKR